MNKKGFTLVELLAVIVILGLVAGISIVAVFTSLRKAKVKAEKEFLTQLSNSVEAYIDLCRSNMATDKGECSVFDSITEEIGSILKSHGNIQVYKDNYNDANFFDNIVHEGIINRNDFMNPVNSKDCYNGAYIHFYKDDDFVYYYKIVLPACVDYNENVIHSLPNGFSNKGELTSGLLPIGDFADKPNGGGKVPTENDNGFEFDDEKVTDEKVTEEKVTEEKTNVSKTQ